MKILVTGGCGFIGYHLLKQLQGREDLTIFSIDNINSYYDVQLKYDRLRDLGLDYNYGDIAKKDNIYFERVDINDLINISAIFSTYTPDIVIHLAAQAGVRYSLENPESYIGNNINGFQNIIDLCREYKVKHFIYASSSSVYGHNQKVPFSVKDTVDSPASLYAATKKSNELVAYTYSHLYNLPTTGLRFFTVYGPWGRPDMAYYIFSDAVRNKSKIKVFNGGEMSRDFTYVDDIVKCIDTIIYTQPKNIYNIYNLGNNNPTSLKTLVSLIEDKFNTELEKEYTKMMPGDVIKTYADITETQRDFNFKPSTSLSEGLDKFVEWYRNYYQMN